MIKSSNRFKRLVIDVVLSSKGLRKSYLSRRINARKQPIKIYWWRGLPDSQKNFGDEITSDIVRKLIGYRCERVSIEECQMIGAGSILEIALKRTSTNTIHVWGSGLMFEDSGEVLTDKLVYHAVRGDLTRARIGGKNNIPVGDPGLLANLVYERAETTGDKIGVVAHFIDRDLPIVAKIEADDRFTLINPLETPENVAKQITECQLVLSSSLHGLIFADAYNIPNKHVVLSNRVAGDSYKFKDYYSATNRPYAVASASRIFEDIYLASLIDSYKGVSGLQSIQRSLLKAFPSNF